MNEFKAFSEQIDKETYKDMAIQPTEYIECNGLGYCEGNVIRLISRWREKGLITLYKARHYLDMLIELERTGRTQYWYQKYGEKRL